MGSTYASNSPITMTTSNAEDDFTLYPYHDQFSSAATTFPASTAYAEHYYAPATSFEPYPAHRAYTYPPHDMSFNQQFQQLPKAFVPSQSPSYSPANSAFEFHPPMLSSTSDSGASGPSTISSAMASPSLSAQNVSEWTRQHPGIVHHDGYHMYTSDAYDTETIPAIEKIPGCVDPSLIDPYASTSYTSASFPEIPVSQSPLPTFPNPPSPVPSQQTIAGSNQSAVGPIRSTSRAPQQWQPYPSYAPQRRESVVSERSQASHHSHSSSVDSSDENRGICPIPSCGRHIKDLKAHMLTHQNERPEKCPIPSCEYHIKGFARKYDKNRHTLTHYKGTMVCGFCPGSGSASEKSFNRADVFKRHLTSVHGVEQTAPNSRRKSPTSASSSRKGFQHREASGTCSTCGVVYANAQAFYEHLDDCVLRVVQQADPSEAINERLLVSMADDQDVQATLSRHNLPTSIDYTGPTSFDQDDDEEDADVKSESTAGSKRKAGKAKASQ